MSVPAVFTWFPGTEHEHTEPCEVGRVDVATGFAHVTWPSRPTSQVLRDLGVRTDMVRRPSSWEPLNRLTFQVGTEPWRTPASVTR